MASKDRMTAVQARVQSALASGENVLLYGPPETGKSEYVRQWTVATGVSLSRFPVTRGASGQSLFGFFTPKDAGWHYTYGAACRAAKNAGVLLLDDIHVAGPDLESALYTAADRHEIELSTGEIIMPERGYRVVATSNEAPSALPEAIQSRFPVQIEVPDTLPAAIAPLHPTVKQIAQGKIASIGLRQCWALHRMVTESGLTLAAALRIVAEEAQAVEVENAVKMVKASGVQK